MNGLFGQTKCKIFVNNGKVIVLIKLKEYPKANNLYCQLL